MFKRIIVAVIAAQLVIVPAQAETQNKPQCTQGDMVTTFLTIYFIVSIVTGIAGAMKKIKTEQSIEQEKKMEKQAPTCSL